MANTTIARMTLKAHGTHKQQYDEWLEQRKADRLEELRYSRIKPLILAFRRVWINARAAEVEAGASDDSDHQQYLSEMADAKDDRDYSLGGNHG